MYFSPCYNFHYDKTFNEKNKLFYPKNRVKLWKVTRLGAQNNVNRSLKQGLLIIKK